MLETHLNLSIQMLLILASVTFTQLATFPGPPRSILTGEDSLRIGVCLVRNKSHECALRCC
ncbi:hypothetical protein M433DRAFT_390385 [Acidomyces richmondensis BFW]|nr:MAG: hypothetical protein FE78DRAFT_453391 [Acidomyces sp. 'richmondensis']KYG50463.1 hypothetical protein M433DRAFT_390385 [Acidomyces richmondensis BFW]